MKYKVFVVKRADEAQEILNKHGKKGYRIVPGSVIVLGGKTCLVMEKGKPQGPVEVSSPKPEPAKKDPLTEKTSEDSVEVR